MEIVAHFDMALPVSYSSLAWNAQVRLNIRIARNAKNWDLGTLAEKIPTSVSTLSRWETGETPITLEKLEAIARALEVEPKELMP